MLVTDRLETEKNKLIVTLSRQVNEAPKIGYDSKYAAHITGTDVSGT